MTRNNSLLYQYAAAQDETYTLRDIPNIEKWFVGTRMVLDYSLDLISGSALYMLQLERFNNWCEPGNLKVIIRIASSFGFDHQSPGKRKDSAQEYRDKIWNNDSDV